MIFYELYEGALLNVAGNYYYFFKLTIVINIIIDTVPSKIQYIGHETDGPAVCGELHVPG
jgi:hypothetical protein